MGSVSKFTRLERNKSKFTRLDESGSITIYKDSKMEPALGVKKEVAVEPR